MTVSSLTLYQNNPLLPANADKNTKERVTPFLQWLAEQELSWLTPDLERYKWHLFRRGLAATSVQAHLSTIRGRYKRLIKSNELRDILFEHTDPELPFTERKSRVDELLVRLQNAIDPANAPVEIIKRQDHEPHYRMTKEQAIYLMNAPGLDSLRGIRDTFLISLLLCTGIRESEVASLVVDDLYRVYENEPALEIRQGKGNKQRFVLYGEFIWVLDVAEVWRDHAGIDDGPLFRGFWKDGSVRPTGLNPRSIQYILSQYPIPRRDMRTGRTINYVPTPHDYRYTYARLAHESGMPIEAIARNMGHSDIKTTMLYIGDISAALRRPKDFYK